MTVLVTGAAGFVGGGVVRRLVAEGRGVRAHVRRPGGAGAAALDGVADEVLAGDLLVPEAVVPLVEGVDTVVHAAAGMRGAAADRYRSTVIGTRNLLTALAGGTVRRIVLISSIAVYGTHDLATGAVIDERTPLEPHPARRSAYVLAKLDQEAVAREHATRLGIELVVLRPGVVYGPGDAGLSDRIGLTVRGRLFVLGGSATLPLAYLDNCADAIALACTHPEAAGATVNVHDDDLPTGRDFLRQRAAALGPLPTVPVPYPALLAAGAAVEWYHRRSKGQLPAVVTPYGVVSRYRDFAYSNRALRSLGWSPRVTTAEGLARTFAAADREDAP